MTGGRVRSGRLGELSVGRSGEALRWAALLAVSWLILRPSLLITISLDDFLNPFYLFDRYGPSPFGMVSDMSRDLTRNGHFNYIGQNVGATIFVFWTYLISWGVRYSLIYATTKFIVFVLTGLVVARLLRTLAALAGREVSVWRSRALVCLVLFSSLQLHVAWGLDPVGSFPLFGYLAAAVGLFALDLSVHACQSRDTRSAVVAAVGLCVAVQYYELNVVMIAALMPVVLVLLRAPTSEPPAADSPVATRRRLLVRVAAIVAPCLVMVAVLRTVAAAANRGYTGTDVALGDGTFKVLVRALAGSLPGSAWSVARDWLGQPVGLFSTTVVSFVVVAAVVLGWRNAVVVDASAPRRTSRRTARRHQLLGPGRWWNLALLASCPVIIWVGATVVQASTAKVGAETLRVGYVYTYYAYGSIGVVLVGLLVVLVTLGRVHAADAQWLAALQRARPVLVAVALAFVFVQTAINDNVQRVFDQRLAANSAVLVAYSEEAPAAVRCATLEAWNALPYWLPYYRFDFIDGINASYQHFHGEPFCASLSAG